MQKQRNTPRNHRRWVWTELLAFDCTREDCGVEEYLQTMGFVPNGISLLVTAPDFVLQHEGLEQDAILPPDICSRNGQEGNEQRSRQEWTRYRLRDLITKLRAAGSKVYFSVFTHYLQNKFHREWLTDYPEIMTVSASEGRLDALFPLARFRDGSYFQDFFAKQMVRVCLDYGLDGWHGSDGYGPQWGIFKFGCSDDFVAQFVERGHALPAHLAASCENRPEALTQRIEWIWRHLRLEWIEFYSDRWAEFWKTICDALHAIGRDVMINSAWTKDPFEAKYRYGVDYRKIAAAGVGAMMVETCAGGILLGSDDRDYHSDYLAMLMCIRTYVPEMELIFLHNIKDVGEDWDLLRHAPAMLEREIYSLVNVYYAEASGGIRRCIDGFLGCLADGITTNEWGWLEERWALAFEALPRKVIGATLLWSDAMVDAQLAEFSVKRNASAHYLTYKLLEHNAPIQQIARFGALKNIAAPFLILNPHLLSEEERAEALDSKKELILIGPDFSGWPKPEFEYRDGDRVMGIRLYGLDISGLEPEENREEVISEIPEDPLSIEEPPPFRAELIFRPISTEFIKVCARIIQHVTHAYTVENQQLKNLVTPPPFKFGIMMTELEDGTLRVAVKNRATIYGRPIVDVLRKIESVQVRGTFPVTKVKSDETKFKVVVPQRGIVILDIQTGGKIRLKEASKE